MLRRIVAPNASEMTFTGTNTYVFGTEDLTIIDPGPNDDQHLEAILNAIGTAAVSKILVPHSYIDHTELVGRLKSITEATVYAHRQQKFFIQDLHNATRLHPVSEGIDWAYTCDKYLEDGEVIESKEG